MPDRSECDPEFIVLLDPTASGWAAPEALIYADAEERERALAEEMEMLGLEDGDPCLIGWPT